MQRFASLTAAFATFGLVGAASAADMPVKAPMLNAPMVAPVYNWTGCYIGANAGWIGGTDRIQNRPSDNPPAFTQAEIDGATKNLTLNGSGFTGGGQVGCNWQGAASPLVLGVEADFNGSSLNRSTSNIYPADTFIARTETNTAKLTWFSTVRGRVGYAADHWLIYATGGLAVGHINSSFNWVSTPGGVTFYSGSDSQTRTGWTAGGGLEYAITNNWSAKLEYLYLDFGTFTFVSPNQLGAVAAWKTDVHARDHVVRVGLNYKFY